MGGDIENPTYEELGSDETGYIEVVKVTYDSNITSYEDLLTVFWDCHDPTSWDYQKGDVGNLYRSVIFYYSEAQKNISENAIVELNKSDKYSKPIVTQVIKAKSFLKAKESDQHYYAKHNK